MAALNADPEKTEIIEGSSDLKLCDEESIHRSVSFCISQQNPHSSSLTDDDTDSAVCSDVSLPRAINFSIEPPTQPNSSSSQDDEQETLHKSVSVCKGPYNFLSHRFPPVCDICQSSMSAIKFCRTCDVNYCENHLKYHYRVPKLQKHQLEDIMQDGQFMKGKPQHKSTNTEEVEHLKSKIEALERSNILHMTFIFVLVVSAISFSIWKQK